MTRTVYRFTFEPGVPMAHVLRGLLLSTTAVEAIYGESAMMVDGKFSVCKRERTCDIDAETQVGMDLAKVFAKFMNLHSGGCFRTEFVEEKAPTGDILDLCGAVLQ